MKCSGVVGVQYIGCTRCNEIQWSSGVAVLDVQWSSAGAVRWSCGSAVQ